MVYNSGKSSFSMWKFIFIAGRKRATLHPSGYPGFVGAATGGKPPTARRGGSMDRFTPFDLAIRMLGLSEPTGDLQLECLSPLHSVSESEQPPVVVPASWVMMWNGQ
ncbi:uncharacterized protein LOC123318939 isoform X1 [Coccinella septempunctata]|uniref:uncharacterized protein LOC123318938 isoform X1 n=1 Tax=Coccinella septempunctata TaxID=41139 RepID=UPI001D09995A|nr:uncharacterized protein LOC123318938 isoform X1 [Coccinella septempunctata]XP_044761662.1 uncharacterized protein LOC123318939 isoform X1 [Coccinella septempunctata]